MNQLPTKGEFAAMLCRHDWLHDRSDDHRRWEAGHRKYQEIMRCIKADAGLREIYIDFINSKK